VRLRRRLRLYFGLTVLFSLLVLAAAGLIGSRGLLRSAEQERLGRALLTLESELGHEREYVASALRQLSTSPELGGLLLNLSAAAPPAAETFPLAGRFSEKVGLSYLELLDSGGRVLSSAQWPARCGYQAQEEAALAASCPGKAVFHWMRVGEETVLAVVGALPVGRGAGRVIVVGGRPVDRSYLVRLQRLVGGLLVVVGRDRSPWLFTDGRTPAPEEDSLSCVEGEWTAESATVILDGQEYACRSLRLEGCKGETSRILVGQSREAARRLGRRAAWTFGGVGLLGLLAAMVLAGILARGITGPIERLAGAARRVAEGDRTAKVGGGGSDEIGSLIRSFDRMVEELRSGEDRLRAAERVAAWREMARRLAHEIKNPLSPIQLSVESMRKARERGLQDFDEIFQEGTGAVIAEVARLREIIDAFSRFARMPSPQLSRQDLNEIVHSALSVYSAPPEGITVAASLAPGPLFVNADPAQLKQALLNLLKNAVEAVSGGGAVRVSTNLAGTEAFVRVEDDGPGLSEEARQKLFTPYFTTKAEGTGLGLVIVHRIVTEHAGRIEATGGPGGGATFTVWLPLAG
jgi:two-component system nitrogen regulation sensor histidine kinase NtrY